MLEGMALVKRSVVTIVGVLVVATGFALMVLPGGIVIVTSVILLTTTALALRDARSDGPSWLG